MKAFVLSMTFVASLLIAVASDAQAPATAPAGTTALCNDGTYYTGASKQGACRGHQGVKDWYGAAAATTPAVPPRAPAPAPAAGGGPGQVWVNTSSKVYHCPTDKWYGKTKHGEYMSEADAQAQGFHADHGKPCH